MSTPEIEVRQQGTGSVCGFCAGRWTCDDRAVPKSHEIVSVRLVTLDLNAERVPRCV